MMNYSVEEQLNIVAEMEKIEPEGVRPFADREDDELDLDSLSMVTAARGIPSYRSFLEKAKSHPDRGSTF